jgi:glycosyltransferase involved in cell wall biosynthesis
MKVSLITVVYNNKHFIEDSIRSVLIQNYSNIEYIIIDGGSTDGTLNIINKYKSHIDIIVSESDNGIYDAMNKGILKSSGDIIGFLNSDDFFTSSNIVSDIINIFDTNDISIVYANVSYVKKYDTNVILRNWISKKYHKNYFELGNVPAHPTFYVKKKIYIENEMFDTNLKFAADYDLMFRFLKIKNYPSFYYNQRIIKMRIGGATSKNIKNIIKQNIEIYNIWKMNSVSMPFYTFPLKLINKLKQYYVQI